MKKSKNSYLAATKLSDYEIKRVIRFYAEGVSAAEAARHMRTSYVTIRRLYHLIRKRMAELPLYPTMRTYLGTTEPSDPDSAVLAYIQQELGRRGGVTSATRPYHEAELLYRRTQGPVFGKNFTQSHYAEILAFIRVSGPLNRPLTKAKRQAAIDFWLRRTLARLRLEALKADTEYEREHGRPREPRYSSAFSLE